MNAESEPTRLEVPLPQLNEEYRQLAEALADLHYVLAVIIKNAGKINPRRSRR